MAEVRDIVGDGGISSEQASRPDDETLIVARFEPEPKSDDPGGIGDDRSAAGTGRGEAQPALSMSERGSSRLADRFSFLRSQSPVPVYVGIGLVIAGFVVIGFAWGKVAGLTNVALQVPYLVSGGLTGLGCIMVGITVISVSAKRREADATARELRELREVVKELRDALVDDGEKG